MKEFDLHVGKKHHFHLILLILSWFSVFFNCYRCYWFSAEILLLIRWSFSWFIGWKKVCVNLYLGNVKIYLIRILCQSTAHRCVKTATIRCVFKIYNVTRFKILCASISGYIIWPYLPCLWHTIKNSEAPGARLALREKPLAS